MKQAQKNTHSANTHVKRTHIRPNVTLAQTRAMLNPNAAGIDIASDEHWGCVPEDRAENTGRRLGAFTQDRSTIADWLKTGEVTTVAMESTGIYWIPRF